MRRTHSTSAPIPYLPAWRTTSRSSSSSPSRQCSRRPDPHPARPSTTGPSSEAKSAINSTKRANHCALRRLDFSSECTVLSTTVYSYSTVHPFKADSINSQMFSFDVCNRILPQPGGSDQRSFWDHLGVPYIYPQFYTVC